VRAGSGPAAACCSSDWQQPGAEEKHDQDRAGHEWQADPGELDEAERTVAGFGGGIGDDHVDRLPVNSSIPPALPANASGISSCEAGTIAASP